MFLHSFFIYSLSQCFVSENFFFSWFLAFLTHNYPVVVITYLINFYYFNMIYFLVIGTSPYWLNYTMRIINLKNEFNKLPSKNKIKTFLIDLLAILHPHLLQVFFFSGLSKRSCLLRHLENLEQLRSFILHELATITVGHVW